MLYTFSKYSRQLRLFSEQIRLNSLTATSSLHQAWKLKQEPDSSTLQYIKLEIRTHHPDHLAAMIYYSAKLNIKDSELWSLFEMQVTRTDSVQLMNLTSVIKAFEGFARWSTDAFEAFDMLEMNLHQRVHLEQCGANVLAECLFTLASLNRTENAYKKVLASLKYNKEGISKEAVAKVLWSLSVTHWSPADIKEWLEVFNQIPGDLDEFTKRMFRWTMEKIKFNNNVEYLLRT